MIDFVASIAVLRLVSLAAIFLLVAMLTFGALSFASRRALVRGELTKISAAPSAGPVESLAKRRDTAWERIADRIEGAGLSLADTKGDVLRKKLKLAGFDSPAAPRIYTLVRLLMVISFPTLVVSILLLRGEQVSLPKLYAGGTISALLGLFLPAVVVRAKADRRRERLVHSFPDCLDLMLVCVEAGLGLEAAIDRVAREMALSHPLVASLLTAMTLRLRAGSTCEEALRNLADEAGVDEIASFATLLIQSDRLGTSIGTTLRVYASEMRERRRMRAEEKAHRLPVLLSIPLVVCMLPVMIGTLMLPAAIRMVREVMPAMAGGG